MDWERAGRITGRFFLLFLEYCFKISALIVASITLAAKGSFGTKLAAGFTSLSPALRRIVEAPGKISETATIINDYNTLSAAVFSERYGGQAIDSVLIFLNEGILYFQAIYQNMVQQPLVTLIAAGIAFITLYLLGRILRFARQKGRGSYIHRIERKIGDRVFRSSGNIDRQMKQHQHVQQTRKKESPASSGQDKSSNYLKKYIKSHQSSS